MSEALPKGWMQTTFLNVALLNPKSSLNDDVEVAFVPMPHVPTNFSDKMHFENRLWRDVKKGFTHFRNDDVIFAKITPCFENGKAVIVPDLPNAHGAGSTEFYVLRPVIVTSAFLFYWVKTSAFLKTAEAQMTGTVGQKRVPKTFVESHPFPLPPLNEQKRIVAKLDAIMPRIDSVKERLETIPAILKRFRQSVLTAAVTGKLTEKRREEHPEVESEEGICSKFDIPSTWMQVKLGELIERIQAGKNFECPSIPVTSETVGLVKISAVTWDKFNPKETKTVLDKKMVNEELFIQKGDFLISRANTIELVGSSVIVDEMIYRIMLSDKVWRVEFNNVLKLYVHFFLKSRIGRDEIESRATGNQASMRNISQKAFHDIDFPLPPLEEQKEIVRQVEKLFALADKVEEHFQKAKARMDALAQSVLAKAFRGELVPQDPDDEPAEKLLQRIEEEKAKMEAELKNASRSARGTKRNGSKAQRAKLEEKQAGEL